MRRRTLLSSSNNISECEMEYVDLGLPSGVLWGSHNIGACSETDYGNYYQWGVGATTYKNTTQYWTGSTELPELYDTVVQTIAGGGRMPTQAEFQELKDNTTYQFTQINGVNGAKLISNSDPTKYIFIPAAGGYDTAGSMIRVGERGFLWSKTPYSNTTQAYSFYTRSDSCNLYNYNRRYGFSVRPVYLDPNNPGQLIKTEYFLKSVDFAGSNSFYKTDYQLERRLKQAFKAVFYKKETYQNGYIYSMYDEGPDKVMHAYIDVVFIIRNSNEPRYGEPNIEFNGTDSSIIANYVVFEKSRSTSTITDNPVVFKSKVYFKKYRSSQTPPLDTLTQENYTFREYSTEIWDEFDITVTGSASLTSDGKYANLQYTVN